MLTFISRIKTTFARFIGTKSLIFHLNFHAQLRSEPEETIILEISQCRPKCHYKGVMYPPFRMIVKYYTYVNLQNST